jgi:hypothetical protein|tara:strand:+ start:646 stop:945 length:300 start_codon:yes stop_codon:yes gene_type:complete
METYILEKSPRKNKRFRIYMTKPKPHYHDFGQKDGKTFIDGRTEKEKDNWISRHKVNPNWNSTHSAIYHSRMLLWTEKTLDKAIKKYEKLHNVKIKKNF